MIHDRQRLRVALPGKGRLREPTIELLRKAGFSFRAKDRNLYATCTNAEIVFIFVRTDDIPVLVDSGVVDVGLTGSDLILERNANVETVFSLGYGKCRLCVAVRNDYEFSDLAPLQGKTIATSFPTITRGFFKENGIDVNCVEMNGSVEIMVALGLADAIVDIVETGDSLRDNNLKVLKDIGRYETVMVCNRAVAADPRVSNMKRRIEGILVASRYSILEFNIREAALKDAEKVAPGYESPTISHLDEPGWVAVKVMVLKDNVADTMDRLQDIGATAILETEVKNCRL
jgi:ATP phosphoribosyltransferase